MYINYTNKYHYLSLSINMCQSASNCSICHALHAGMTSPRSSSPRSPRGSSPGQSPRGDSPRGSRRGDSPRGDSPRGALLRSNWRYMEIPFEQLHDIECIWMQWAQVFHGVSRYSGYWNTLKCKLSSTLDACVDLFESACLTAWNIMKSAAQSHLFTAQPWNRLKLSSAIHWYHTIVSYFLAVPETWDHSGIVCRQSMMSWAYGIA